MGTQEKEGLSTGMITRDGLKGITIQSLGLDNYLGLTERFVHHAMKVLLKSTA